MGRPETPADHGTGSSGAARPATTAPPDATPVTVSAGPGEAQRHPHGARPVTVASSLGPLAALRADPDESASVGGPPAVALLLPGYSGSKEDFAPLIDPIAAAGIGVLALDLPGQYESPGPATEHEYRPASLGPVIAGVVAEESEAGRRVLLLGHSYGGLVARAAVLVGAPVRGLTLMDSGPGELPMGRRRTDLDVLEPVLRRRGVDAVIALRDAGGHWSSTHPHVVELLRERLRRSALPGLLGMGDALRSEDDRTAELVAAVRSRRVPCLVVCGTDDDAWPVSMQRTMADRLEAEFAAVPHAAHAPNVENPAALLDVLVPTWRTWLRDDILG
ncbi:alpha-beta hydrolase superfamily lysophospholipase [Actinomycetospora succinea]|uniref:Alpha-beta hydrolase superfamily lysophospholipase n=1 Tax=Actinomycetospora succinea TaxID=663603 RepID=A0A4R6VDM9_9PSEU|nr:alpha/beta fold hydrolase [Actinomycetospora succinea]TDQ58490.1 alpha-beta hydrolase superfamily lysophospholipase [Actinomycetospora succinea]